MGKRVMSLKFDEAVWERIDSAAAEAGLSRQAWFDELVGERLGGGITVAVLPGDRITAALHPPAGCMRDPRSSALSDRAEVFGVMSARAAASAPGGVIGGRSKG